ncbi:hypothetical protein ABIE33_005086 [Ensifer sp. 4252]
MIVEGGEIVGLCSVVRVPDGGDLHIGYGVAPTRQGAGAATRAIASLWALAQDDARISAYRPRPRTRRPGVAFAAPAAFARHGVRSGALNDNCRIVTGERATAVTVSRPSSYR